MKKLNVYSVYLDDGKDVFRVTVPAASKKDAAEYVRGNGDVVAIKPADLQDIDLDVLADTLMPYSLSFLLAGKFSDMWVRPGVDTGRRGLTLPACTGRTI